MGARRVLAGALLLLLGGAGASAEAVEAAGGGECAAGGEGSALAALLGVGKVRRDARATRAVALFPLRLRRLRQCFAPGPQPGRATDIYGRGCPDAALPRVRAGALRWARVALGAGVPLL